MHMSTPAHTHTPKHVQVHTHTWTHTDTHAHTHSFIEFPIIHGGLHVLLQGINSYILMTSVSPGRARLSACNLYSTTCAHMLIHCVFYLHLVLGFQFPVGQSTLAQQHKVRFFLELTTQQSPGETVVRSQNVSYSPK